MATKDKGEKILDGMLLDDYNNSPLLKQYFMAFFTEMDYLFEQTEEVYVGRFLETAIGAQLDVLGKILQQPRSVVLPRIFFGFQGATGLIGGMADVATPSIGGEFLNADNSGYTTTPLDDTKYRRVLKVIAEVSNKQSCNISLVYKCLYILLNRVPATILLSQSGRSVTLDLDINETTNEEAILISYMSKYFIPNGISFFINRV